MIDPVKSESPDALGEPFVRTWIDVRRRRQFAVESGIEDRHLGSRTKLFFYEVNPVKLYLIVQRRKNGHPLDRRFHVRSNDGRLRVLTPTVNDPMANNGDFGFVGQHASLAGGKRVKQMSRGFGPRTSGHFFFLCYARGIAGLENGVITLPFDFCVPQR